MQSRLKTRVTLIDYLVPAVVGVVFIVLVLGLWNMLRGGSPNTSQQLMRLRVVAQFLAILLILAVVYFAAR
jgi:H+/Cl- antiporter ClcA